MSCSSEVRIEEATNEDERRLARLGIKQGLPRQFSLGQTSGLVLTNTSMIIGIVPLFSQGLVVGGPVALIWGWVLTSCLTTCTALCLSEICSAYPTAGGLYFWTAKLASTASNSTRSAMAFTTGWFNLIGQAAGISGSVYSGALYCNILVSILFPSLASTALSAPTVFTTFALMMLTCGLCNSAGGTALKVSSFLSIMLHTVGILSLTVVLIASSAPKQPYSFVFTKFIDETGWTSTQNAPSFFVFLLGLLPSAWTQIGYDSSAHLSEETQSAHLNAPRAIMLTVFSSIVTGFLLLLALLFSISPDYAQQIASASQYANQVPVQIFMDACGPIPASLFCLTVALAGLLCGIGSVASNSRCAFAISRDAGLPFSYLLSHLDPVTGMPQRLVWTSITCATILALPSLFSSTVLNAVSALSIIGFTVSYTIPIACRLVYPFTPAEFTLGRWSGVLCGASVVWTCLLVVVFQFPNAAPAFPVTSVNFNYAPVVFAVLCTGIGGWWIGFARHSFKGPA